MSPSATNRNSVLEWPRGALLYSEDAEQAVLSSILFDPQALRVVRPQVRAEDFFAAPHGHIFAAAVAIADQGITVDPIALATELERRGQLEASGGKDYIGWLVDAVPTSDNVDYYAAIIAERAQRRAIQAAALTMHQAAGDLQLEPRAVAAAQRDALERFVTAIDSGSLPPAIRASEAPPAEPIAWRIDDLWPAGEFGLIVGDGGSFKSTAAIHIAGAIAGGYHVFGRFAASRAPTMIVSAEDSRDVVLMRLRAFAAGQRWAPSTLDDVHVLAEPDASLADPVWQRHIMAESARVGAKFIAFDPLAELTEADENSNTEMRPYVKYFRRLARGVDAAVAVVHHAGKADPQKRHLDRIRGASCVPNAARTILFFEHKPDGVLVTHVKSSRAMPVQPFFIRRWIDSEDDNRAQWVSASLRYEENTTAELSRGAEFVIAQISASPARLSTSDLKRIAAGSGVRGEDVSNALASLNAAGRVTFADGQRGKRLWSLVAATLPVTPVGKVGNLEELTLPTLPAPCPGNLENDAIDLAHPLKGGQGGQRRAGPSDVVGNLARNVE